VALTATTKVIIKGERALQLHIADDIVPRTPLGFDGANMLMMVVASRHEVEGITRALICRHRQAISSPASLLPFPATHDDRP
jgi:hypothetical protein